MNERRNTFSIHSRWIFKSYCINYEVLEINFHLPWLWRERKSWHETTIFSNHHTKLFPPKFHEHSVALSLDLRSCRLESEENFLPKSINKFRAHEFSTQKRKRRFSRNGKKSEHKKNFFTFPFNLLHYIVSPLFFS